MIRWPFDNRKGWGERNISWVPTYAVVNRLGASLAILWPIKSENAMTLHEPGTGKIKPEKAMEILRKNGVEVDVHQALKILDLMYFFAKLTLDQLVEK